MKEKHPAPALPLLALGVLLSLFLGAPGPSARAGVRQPGLEPHIAIDSLSLSASAVEPGVVTRTLTLTNTGNSDLQFQILESKLILGGGAIVPALAEPSRSLDGQAQVDPQIGTELRAAGTADFFVQMRAQADLSGAYHLVDWQERGRYVYAALLDASRGQEPVMRYAQARGLEARSYLVNNAVLIRGGAAADVAQLAGRADVARLRAVHTYPLAGLPGSDAARTGTWTAATGMAAPDLYGWNLGELDPNRGLFGTEVARAWQELGVRGESIVMGSIDTGVYYQHEALVRQYRGNQGDGTFDHDYNWRSSVPPMCGDGSSPCDVSGHGTGTTGLAVGETEDLAHQIGVAPGARWIACQACEATNCADDQLLACGDWMLAPTKINGTAANPDLRPHIVNNSWGGTGCDPWYLAQLEAWQAAGILPVFSAGNATICRGLSDPGDMVPALAIAAHGPAGTNLYAGGPVVCADPPSCDPFLHQIKPNVNAPSYARTADRCPGCYVTMTGTSASSPHGAGCAALLWSAQPALVGDLGATFTILEQTADRSLLASWNAGDCGRPECAGGAPYPNYEYGWGYLDCYTAVDSLIVPWVSTSVVSGTLEPDESRTVEVALQCDVGSALEPQPLRGTLRIGHNDPGQDPLNVDLSFLCLLAHPVPAWEKSAWINGQALASLPGPHTVQAGDSLLVVDRVGTTYSEPVSLTLAAGWNSDALALLSSEASAGSVSAADGSLAWDLRDVAPNTTYVLTKTLEVQSGTWSTATLLESLAVEGAAEQLPDIVMELSQVHVLYLPLILRDLWEGR